MSNSRPAPIFTDFPMARPDPILGLTDAFNADSNPAKVNLGVGVYYDDEGRIPLLNCVRLAKTALFDKTVPHTYLPIDGMPAFNDAVQNMIFGKDCSALLAGRTVTVQSLGGTGALKIGADFLKRFLPEARIWLSDPSWENHRAIFEASGFQVDTYPYYDATTLAINFDGMIEKLKSIPPGGVILLHACCHNPTGLDLSAEQWLEVISVIRENQLIPFLDMAYQGFSQNLEADGQVIRHFARNCPYVLIANSYSKSFSLYGERIGSFSLVTTSKEETDRALSQIKRIIRTNYSNPARHGAEIVTTVLTTPELHLTWENELSSMRERIRQMRTQLARDLSSLKEGMDFSYITLQNGLFSYSGLTEDQVGRLRTEHSIYAVSTGRICVAALNSANIGRVASAIASVL